MPKVNRSLARGGPDYPTRSTPEAAPASTLQAALAVASHGVGTSEKDRNLLAVLFAPAARPNAPEGGATATYCSAIFTSVGVLPTFANQAGPDELLRQSTPGTG